jgi:hypothetical protein
MNTAKESYVNYGKTYFRNVNTGDYRYTWGLRSCKSPRITKTYNNSCFDVKLAPEFFDAKLIICITFPDKPGEGSMLVTGFKI